jgi:hypothetical protein
MGCSSCSHLSYYRYNIIVIIITTIADTVIQPVIKAKELSPFYSTAHLGCFSVDEDYGLAGIGCQHNFSTFFIIET